MSALDRLALDGGTPRLAPSSLASWPQFTSDDDLEVLRAARQGIVTDGQRSVTKLERLWHAATGRATVIAAASGPVALRLVVAGLELEPCDEVICPAGSASTAAGLTAAGLTPVPVDIDPETLHIDPGAVEASITDRTRAVVAVDRYGTTADYRALDGIAHRHDVAVVEDGSRSMGATYDRLPVGALGSASICVLANDTASRALGAGALYGTDDEFAAANARRYMLVDDVPGADLLDLGAIHPGWVEALAASPALAQPGAMAELDAAIAVNRIDNLDDDVAARSANGNHLRRRLESLPGIWMPEVVRGATHTYSAFPILVLPDEVGLPESTATALRDTVVDCMTAEGLWMDAVRPGPDLGPAGRFPVAEAMTTGGIVLGHNRSPFKAPNGIGEMEQIADCFAKILIDNLDRVRQLTLERTETHVMI